LNIVEIKNFGVNSNHTGRYLAFLSLGNIVDRYFVDRNIFHCKELLEREGEGGVGSCPIHSYIQEKSVTKQHFTQGIIPKLFRRKADEK